MRKHEAELVEGFSSLKMQQQWRSTSVTQASLGCGNGGSRLGQAWRRRCPRVQGGRGVHPRAFIVRGHPRFVRGADVGAGCCG